MFELEYKGAYLKKKNQLDSILLLTTAINSNAKEESLYNIYNSILTVHTSLEKHLLVLCNSEAEVKSFDGIDDISKFQSALKKDGTDSEFLSSEFGDYFSINHQEKRLAHVFLSFDDLLSKKEQLSFIQTVSNIVLVAIENKKFAAMRLEQEAYEKEVHIARDVQNLLFPRELPNNKNLELHADYIPHKAVGGDYYDYIKKSDTEYVICIADVSGKGVPAALLMSNFQATLRTLVRQNLNLREIVHELNTVAFQNTNGEKFITAFIALLDLKRENLYYVNAGHNPPYYVDKNHTITSLKIGSPLLGALEILPKVEIGKIKLSDYSLLFSFTDGLVEVFDEEGNQFDEQVLEDFLRTEKTSSLSEFHNELLEKIRSFSTSGEYNDDITILSCKFTF